MKKLMVAVVIALSVFLVPSSGSAHDPPCVVASDTPDGQLLWCPKTTTTPTPPTATSVPPTTAPTFTPIPATPTATRTSVPTATATPTSSRSLTDTRYVRKNADGTYLVLEAGTYSGVLTCPTTLNVSHHCLQVYAAGTVLDNFTINCSSCVSIHAGSGITFKNGTLNGRGGITGYNSKNLTIDNVQFNVTEGSWGIYSHDAGCETLGSGQKPVANITIRNSRVNNTGTLTAVGHETGYMKCTENFLIENNQFKTASAWMLSFPDSLNVTVRNNVFDLSPETPNRGGQTNWLAIELPRVFGANIIGNSVIGPAPGDWLIYVNSGTRDLTVTDNCITSDMSGVLHISHQAGGVVNLTEARNGICQPFTAPTTGDGGLK